MKAIEDFHKIYYNSKVWDWNTQWLGVRTEKCPLDLWIYQEIIYETEPSLIIETGTLAGGTTLFLASVCAARGFGLVLSIDINPSKSPLPYHHRINYCQGDSVSPDTIKRVEGLVGKKDKVMVILDSDHSYLHVLKELELYSKFVTSGNYLIVEDTNLNGNPVLPQYGPGPMEAVAIFLSRHSEFEIDSSREKFLMTFNPRGYLKKKN